MSAQEKRQLERLIEIRDEDDTPLTEWEVDFVTSLEERSGAAMTPKQADVFDRLVNKHLR